MAGHKQTANASAGGGCADLLDSANSIADTAFRGCREAEEGICRHKPSIVERNQFRSTNFAAAIVLAAWQRGTPIRAAVSAPRHAEKEFIRHAKHITCNRGRAGHVGRLRLLRLGSSWLRRRKVLRSVRARLRVLRRPAYGRVWSRRLSRRLRGWWMRRWVLGAWKLQPQPMLAGTRLLWNARGS